MDPESKKLLEETLALARENNHMLRKVRKVQKWAAFSSALKILIVIGITLGSFYFLEPYVKKAISIWDSVYGIQQQPDNASATPFQDFLKKFKN